MIETHAEAVISSIFYSEEGFLEWRFAIQRFHTEWFYIRQNFVTENGDISGRMLIMDDINELKSLLSTRGGEAWVEDIYLVTPGSVNHTGTWAIDLLLEMKEVVPAPNLVNRNFVYVVNRVGGSYFSTEVDGIWEHKTAKIVYKRNNSAPAPVEQELRLSKEQAARLTKIVIASISLHKGDVAQGAKWIVSPLTELNGKIPIEMLSEHEFSLLLSYIASLE
ncbi:hypothetical protein [Pseudomonas proteolytica]|uniref:hypothetical protein n=1 Tax=Pseudomonas proteolytica TaxID=219574 RepID=UPI0030DA2583